MRIIQIAEDEKINQQHNHYINIQLRNTLINVSQEKTFTYKDFPIVNPGMQLYLNHQYKINKYQ